MQPHEYDAAYYYAQNMSPCRRTRRRATATKFPAAAHVTKFLLLLPAKCLQLLSSKCPSMSNFIYTIFAILRAVIYFKCSSAYSLRTSGSLRT